MIDREKVIKGLEHCIIDGWETCHDCTYYCGDCHECTTKMKSDALALLKAQKPSVMTLEEVKTYLAEPDGDKKPLWLEWSTIPALSGWVLPSQVADLMKRYLDAYGVNWRPWTSRPTDEQREATSWQSVRS